MSSGGGGGGSGVPADTTNVQTIREAPEIEARRLGLMDAARELATKTTTPPAFQVQPMSTAETEALNIARSGPAGTRQMTDAASAIQGAQTAAGKTFSASDVQQAMNPFIQNVVNRIGESYAQKESDLAAKAVASGNFGGGREGVGIAELQRQKADVLGGVYGQGFESALGELQNQRNLAAQTGLSAGQLQGQLAGTALSQRESQLSGLAGLGGLQRGIGQAGLEAARRTALQNIQEPYHCLLYTSPSPRDGLLSRMPSSA